ncbi:MULTISPECIES: ABC transporter substrate-binding protein [unclassified Rhizobium]|uniref:ABC transporter substrate-binding protein n=1 Tax=unclassified Rhizobium TaxID=2613769 RepID=UPI001ADBCD77|nr:MULTISPECIES: ABC transporter substrate-binding protein [unclassified Rhizobium]MBO9096785.1 ABC transporter substrate-binding protein [Rhizobium sp. L58/93]MBO9134342.1 ABC transporter substrate-binding protein [Rhizobium sp. B209b/85]MBO9167040.1 ABC transporter substrate-binding protein [Rhizobium sp. L245/93]MBO9183012.1 ABC transporter substrate-binding protein [Rhizobium sp. E27B/91]QXZ83378.1 ABC transporter substrate-binding protein [Rhizobium sp. K1/93]
MKTIAKAALAAGLLLGTSLSAHAVERGGTLNYGRYADSLFLEPVLNDANVDIWVLSNLYDTLLLPTDDGKGVQAGLASTWKLADDGLSVTLTLRDGIKFSDGTPITPQDVAWSLKRAAKPDNGEWTFIVGSIGDVTTEGDKTVVIKLKNTDPAILTALTVFNTGIMPQKAFEAAAGTTEAEKAKAFAEHPIGSGPFMLKSWDRGSTMKLVRNPYYWGMGEDGKPLPYLDGINFEVIPDDATRILKLSSGELDGAEFIPYSRVDELKSAGNLNMELYPSTRVEYITLNTRPQLNGKDNPLSNAKVREAMNYAANKEAIIQIVTHGVGKPMTSYMSSATPLHTGDKPLFPYDIDKAKSLMKEAGFESGFSTSLLVLAGNQDEIGIATALQQMWAQIGIKLELQQVDNASRTAQYRAGTFAMRESAWTDDIADPNEITSYFVYSPNIGALHTGWKSEEADKLFETSQKEIDVTKRAADYARIQAIYNAEGPIVPLYETPYPVALSKKVHGFLQIPLGNNIFTKTWLDK